MQSTTAKLLRLAAGVVAANLLGAVVCLLYAWLANPPHKLPEPLLNGLLFTVYPNLLLVPLSMGLAAAYIWHPLQLTVSQYLLCSLLTVLVLLGGAYLILREGVICLAIVSPLILIALAAGALIGRVWFQPRPGRLQLVMFPLLVLGMLAEGKITAERASVITDYLVIAAAPEAVWPHVISFPRITSQPDYWLNKVGLPSAAETTCAGEFVGADRACIFSNGLVFKETVSELVPQRRLTFDIVEQPRDPELLGHLDLHRGQFELQPNPDGTTTLIGRSWYTLRVRPLWYFDWWTRDITREVHLRVMRHIKQLSRAAAPLMFGFVVRRLRWLARVPLLPQLFDAGLLMLTWIAAPGRLRAIESLQTDARRTLGTTARAHRFGGIEFRLAGVELGHVHGNGLVDVLVGRSERDRLVSAGDAQPHHIFPASGWVSFWMVHESDATHALQLLQVAAQRRRPASP